MAQEGSQTGKKFMVIEEAKIFLINLGLSGKTQWELYKKGELKIFLFLIHNYQKILHRITRIIGNHGATF